MSAHHITVTGDATEDVCPDEARRGIVVGVADPARQVKLTFGVDTFDPKLPDAIKKSETASTSLVAVRPPPPVSV